jgi:hypothetical protein
VMWKSRAFLVVFRLLFSTFDTSTAKIGFSKPLIERWGEPRLRSVNIVQDLAAVNKWQGGKSSVFPESLHQILWFLSGDIHYGLRCFSRLATSLRLTDLHHF